VGTGASHDPRARLVELARELRRELALALGEACPQVLELLLAIREALARPGVIRMDLVDAQQARRVLDRLVGYGLSPVLWREVASGLSAGRVQSPAVRLVVERERERIAFVAADYWDLTAAFATSPDFTAKLVAVEGMRVATGRDFANDGRVTRDDVAVIDEARATAASRGPLLPTLAPNRDYSRSTEVYARLGRTGEERGLYNLEFRARRNGAVEPVEVDGAEAVRTNVGREVFYVYFDLDDSFLYFVEGRVPVEVTVEVWAQEGLTHVWCRVAHTDLAPEQFDDRRAWSERIARTLSDILLGAVREAQLEER
jgi:hypothetical protein